MVQASPSPVAATAPARKSWRPRLVPLTIFAGREYWGLAFGPAVACYVPAALAGFRARTGARKRPV